MDWRDILIAQAITTVISIARSGDGKGKFRPALMKVLRTIAEQVASEAEVIEILKTVRTR